MKPTQRVFLRAFDQWAGAAFAGPGLAPAQRDALAAQFARVRAAWLEGADLDDEAPREVDALCEAARARLGSYLQHNSPLELAVSKSNLLYRLLYLGEHLRTAPCEAHRGAWSGYDSVFEGERDYPVCECQYLESGRWALDVTGWLPVNIAELRRAGVIDVRPRPRTR